MAQQAVDARLSGEDEGGGLDATEDTELGLFLC
jgi:hypothetical protein